MCYEKGTGTYALVHLAAVAACAEQAITHCGTEGAWAETSPAETAMIVRTVLKCMLNYEVDFR